MDDRRIVELFLNRSEEALLQIDIKYGRYCHRVAFNVLGNAEDSEECVNDAYMRVWGSIPPNEPSSLSAYVECVSGADELERRQDSAEIIDALNGFLETLSATERGVFMRRYWMMEPIADVAARYDISVSKTTTMLFRLRGRLKKHFMKEGISL